MTAKKRMLSGDPFMISGDVYGDKVYFLILSMGDPEDEDWSYELSNQGQYGAEICRPMYNWTEKQFTGFKMGDVSLESDHFTFSFKSEISQTIYYDQLCFDGLEVFAEAAKKDLFGIFNSDDDAM